MDFNILLDNTLLIVPNKTKKDILIDINNKEKLYNYKIMDIKEFTDNYDFSYDAKSIVYLMNKYNFKYDKAKMYLDNIKYVNKEYNNEKIDNLYSIKKELEDNNLLIKNDLFKNYIKTKNKYIALYDNLSNYEKKVLNKANVTIIKKEEKDYFHDVYEFENTNEETLFLFEKISELLKKGVSLSNIKICNLSLEYYNHIYRLSKIYNYKIDLNDDNTYSTNIVNRFISLIKENDKEKTIKILMEEFDYKNDINKSIIDNIIKIINKYYFIDDLSKYIDLLISDFKRIKINKKEKEIIEIIDYSNSYIKDDDYVFILGFNESLIPKVYMDEDYLSDKEKELLGVETSLEKNIKEKETLISFIKNTKNLYISYKLKDNDLEYYPSSLVKDLSMNVIKDNDLLYSYSDFNNKLLLSKKLDNFIKYGEVSKDLELLYSNYKDINYLSFDNKYKKISKDKLNNFLNNKLLLSYSSMDNYYKCSFRYYLNNILKLSKYEETFFTHIGSLFHYVLSMCFNKDFDFEYEYNKYIKENNYDYNNKELFYLDKLKNDLILIIDTIKKQMNRSSFKNTLLEKKVYINENTSVTFVGIVDKILYLEKDNKTYMMIIDYKTGNPNLDLNNTIYGINLQLPLYIYTVSNMGEFKNVEVIGFYLQKILNTSVSYDKKKTYMKQREDSLKLQGFTVDDKKLISLIDDEYDEESYIKSLKTTNSGFSKTSKLLSKEKICNLNKLAKEKIDESAKNILNSNFDINPKIIKNENVGCKYCEYKDICFMSEEDVIYLKDHKDLDFLGGDNND